MTNEEVENAIAELERRNAINTLLYLNSVRNNPHLAVTQDYRTRFNGYYIPAPHPAAFYQTLFGLLYDLALGNVEADLATLLEQMFAGTGQRHLSFCSKLMVTVTDEAVVFDRNVAIYFGVPVAPLPAADWIQVASARYNSIHEGVSGFVTTQEWPATRLQFDNAFPEAAHLPDIRKADLLIWSHIGLQ